MRCDECVYNSPAWVDRRPLCAEVQRGTGTTPGCDFGFKPEESSRQGARNTEGGRGAAAAQIRREAGRWSDDV